MKTRKQPTPETTGLFYRSAALGADIDKAARSVNLTFSSEAPVWRWYRGERIPEVLLHTPEAVDLSRLQEMGAALFNHDRDRIVGAVSETRIINRRAAARVTFDEDADGEMAWGKVQSGSLRGVSVGYEIDVATEVAEGAEYEGIKGPALVATRWTPYEISLTPVPADASVGVGRSSLDGIRMEGGGGAAPINPEQQTEVTDMDEKDVRAMIQEAVGAVEAKIPTAEAIAGAVRAIAAEDARPKMRVSGEELQSLLARAGAIDPALKGRVADLVSEGKTEPEIVRALLDEAAGTTGERAKGSGGPGKNGTGSDGKPTNGDNSVRTFEGLSDDDFLSGLADPAMFPATA